ncbi:carbohydrate ABC transporter permease [Paenibacillus harenae]|uniref:ABC-type glycerol-3-phosphate transport system permease component n=1 Tax=Paenibacillus harenae TaxID=306543 RepID=A0ABT9TZF0_PAEHA|nr:carbohydrate ABC transporter permease [Paenibacillus harenae]MDQ0059293.1 ABC-type glycerol-3-phosphate transport system permease component [Paenibacillus harenae]MDQ0112757.1 ABC-type glycerol-3-phosphate transport system permease component [Paenibacillus harenae]
MLAMLRRKRVNRSWAGDIFLFLILAAVGYFMAMPLVFVISNAFKPINEILKFPPDFFVHHPTLTNFSDLYHLLAGSWVPFTRYIFNTFFIAILGTALHVLIASLAAYPLAKRRFPGRGALFGIVVLSLMFSATVTQITNYMTMSWLGFLDTHLAVIVPAIGSSLGLYLMKQFMEQIPDSLLEAAQIDGCSELRIFWSVVMPVVKPAWLTLIIFSFQGLWGAGGAAGSMYIYSEQLKTIDYALGQILAGGIIRTGPSMAATLLLLTVPILIFVLSQSSVIQTMSTSGMKD